MPEIIKISADNLHQSIVEDLITVFGANEAQGIGSYLLEAMVGVTKVDRASKKTIFLSKEEQEQLKNAVKRLKAEEPVQHVVGYGWFYGRKFLVSKDVLIPRPETEELVHWILNATNKTDEFQLLDIGTGTGCIPITVALECDNFQSEAWDVSEAALIIARENAAQLGAQIAFKRVDILEQAIDEKAFDIIVSNPPYVRESEKSMMSKNVLDFDPELALFVGEDDPLVFYRRISILAKTGLKPGGWLYFEINEAFGQEMKSLLEQMNYGNIELRKDINGKDRMIKGQLTIS